MGGGAHLEHRYLDSCNVVHPDLDLLLRHAHTLDHGGLDVASGVLDLSEGEVALPERRAHVLLRLEDAPQQQAEAHGEGVRLLLEQAVALLGADQLDFHDLQVLPRREDIKPRPCAAHASVNKATETRDAPRKPERGGVIPADTSGVDR